MLQGDNSKDSRAENRQRTLLKSQRSRIEAIEPFLVSILVLVGSYLILTSEPMVTGKWWFGVVLLLIGVELPEILGFFKRR